MAFDLGERFEPQQDNPDLGDHELGSMTPEDITGLLTRGFVVVDVSDSATELVREAEIREWMLDTEDPLGGVVPHGRSDDTGIAEQGVAFFGSEAEGQVLHADASYMSDSEVPGVVLIGCVNTADNGGKTTLADARQVIEELFRLVSPEEHAGLITGLTTPAYFVKRPDDDRQLVLPILSISDDDSDQGYFGYRYGDHQYHIVEVLDHARTAVSALETVLWSERLARTLHQLTEGQVLILNNLSMLHGRQAFAGGERKLLRLWRGGDGLPLLPRSDYMMKGDQDNVN